MKARQTVTIHVRTPRALLRQAAAAAAAASSAPAPAGGPARAEPPSFTTKSYRRAVHGRHVRQAARQAPPQPAPEQAPRPRRTAAERTAAAEGALPASAVAPAAVKTLRDREGVPLPALLEPPEGDPDAGY
jgi:hypothetical protein